MIKAIFFDMDGTLLPLDMGEYLPRHFADLAGHIFPKMDVDAAVKAQWKVLGALMHQGDGRHAGTMNRVLFEREMSAATKIPFDDYRFAYERYYDEDVHAFASAYPAHPRAMEPVKIALDKGLHCVLSTNPVFPRKHTRARMQWAALDMNAFEFYTVMEDSATTKPHRAFILECVEKLGGVSPEECAFVGNDRVEDMWPAHRLGMKTFFLNYMPANKHIERCWDGEGDFDELREFIEAL